MVIRHHNTSPGVIGLSKREVLALAGRPGTRIESRCGSIWVTQDGDLRDIVLAAGQAHVLDRAGPVLVQALDSALVAVRPSARSAQALTGLWRRLTQAALSA